MCYNQEQYIRESILSVLAQTRTVDEFIIVDDHSTDRTPFIAERYAKLFPSMIRLIVNSRNLGIFDNVNSIKNYPSGDIIHMLAGDDFYAPRMVESIDKHIATRSLIPSNQRFLIIPRTIFLKQYTEIDETVDFDQLKGLSIIQAVILQRLHHRHVGCSKALWDETPIYPKDAMSLIGPWADYWHHVTHMTSCDNVYFVSELGPYYRVGVGVASKFTRDELTSSFVKACKLLIEDYLAGKLRLSRENVMLLQNIVFRHTGQSLEI